MIKYNTYQKKYELFCTKIEEQKKNSKEYILNNSIKELDKQINQITESLVNSINEIGILEQRKTEIDEKRKYALEMGSSEEKIKEIKRNFNNRNLYLRKTKVINY